MRVHCGTGEQRAELHRMTLKELAGSAAGAARPVALETQLAALKRKLAAKQAEVDAGRADLAHRQSLLRFAAGAVPWVASCAHS